MHLRIEGHIFKDQGVIPLAHDGTTVVINGQLVSLAVALDCQGTKVLGLNTTGSSVLSSGGGLLVVVAIDGVGALNQNN